MNQLQFSKIKQVVKKWLSDKEFSFQERDVVRLPNSQNDEITLVFRSFTRSFFYDNQAKNVILLDFNSKPFITTTLSDNALIDSIEQDVNRLKLFLKSFDKETEEHRNQIFSQYEGKIYTSNPELWDL